MNGESPHKVGGDETESTQVIKPAQAQDKNSTQSKPASGVTVSLYDSATDNTADSKANPGAAAAETTPPQPVAPAEVEEQSPTTVPQIAEPSSPWNVGMDPQTEAGYDNSFEQAPLPEVHWTASEFIAHEKSPLWYLSLAGISAILIAFAVFVVHDVVAVVSIFLIAILFGAVASHKPRTLQYTIDGNGITMGKKVFSYGEFKSFGVVKEEAFSNITLTPLKRFSPPLSIYYPPEEEENIVQVLAAYLPVAPVQSDMIDSLLRRIRL